MGKSLINFESFQLLYYKYEIILIFSWEPNWDGPERQAISRVPHGRTRVVPIGQRKW